MTFNLTISRILCDDIARCFPSSSSCASDEWFYIEFPLSLFLVLFYILLNLVAVIALSDCFISSSLNMVTKVFLNYQAAISSPFCIICKEEVHNSSTHGSSEDLVTVGSKGLAANNAFSQEYNKLNQDNHLHTVRQMYTM